VVVSGPDQPRDGEEPKDGGVEGAPCSSPTRLARVLEGMPVQSAKPVIEARTATMMPAEMLQMPTSANVPSLGPASGAGMPGGGRRVVLVRLPAHCQIS